MFRPSTRQSSLLEPHLVLSKTKRERLEQSWAHAFRTRVMPHIDEEILRDAYHADNGRPNYQVRILVGLLLLKDAADLTDEQTLEQFEYNLQWHYALGVTADDAHLARRTLFYFRSKLMESDLAHRMFESVTARLARAEGVRLGKQRVDSTHVLSNIAVLTRLGLFCETTSHLMRALRTHLPERLARLDARFAKRYLDREGYFADATKEQARRRLPEVAADIAALVAELGVDEAVAQLEEFKLLRRLFQEQIEVVGPDDDDPGTEVAPAAPSETAGGNAQRAVRVRLREPKTISGTSLQSPHVPDATYGHKGKGYHAQLVETCDADNALQLITAVDVCGAHASDQHATVAMVEQLQASDMAPSELVADTGYGSGANIIACHERGVELLAPVQDPSAVAKVDRFLAAGTTATAAPAAAEDATPMPDATAPLAQVQAWMATQLLDGVDLAAFAFTATYDAVLGCPNDHAPARQQLTGKTLVATFSTEHCSDCVLAKLCPTRQLADGSRQLQRSPASIATEVRQYVQRTAAFKEAYKIRSGIEATNSVMKRCQGMRKLRVRGQRRVKLAVTLRSLSLNAQRVSRHHARLAAEHDGGEAAA